MNTLRHLLMIHRHLQLPLLQFCTTQMVHQYLLKLIKMLHLQVIHHHRQIFNLLQYIKALQSTILLKWIHLLLLKMLRSKTCLLMNLLLRHLLQGIQTRLLHVPTYIHMNISGNEYMIIRLTTLLNILLYRCLHEGNLPPMPCGAVIIPYYPNSNPKISRLLSLKTIGLMRCKMKLAISIDLKYGNWYYL